MTLSLNETVVMNGLPPSLLSSKMSFYEKRKRYYIHAGSFLKLLIFIGEQDDVCTSDLLSEARGTQAYFSAEMLFE